MAQLSQRSGSVGVDQATGVEAFNVDERHAEQADPYRPHTGGEGVADGVEDEAWAVGGAEELHLILDQGRGDGGVWLCLQRRHHGAYHRRIDQGEITGQHHHKLRRLDVLSGQDLISRLDWLEGAEQGAQGTLAGEAVWLVVQAKPAQPGFVAAQATH